MKLSELYAWVCRTYDPSKPLNDLEVMVEVKLPYATIGPKPMVPVSNVSAGFDWEKGKFIIRPETPLMPADIDFAEKLWSMQERVGKLELENRSLKSKLKKFDPES